MRSRHKGVSTDDVAPFYLAAVLQAKSEYTQNEIVEIEEERIFCSGGAQAGGASPPFTVCVRSLFEVCGD